MTGKMRILLLLVLISSMMILDTDSACACSCVAPGPPDEERANAAAVFVGKVIDIDNPFSFGPISSADPTEVTFQVQEVWKGSVSQTTTITTSRSSASCGYPFEKGGEYMVYAHGSENDYFVSLCSRTQPLENAEYDLEVFGPGAAPLADRGDWPGNVSSTQMGILLGTVLGVVLIVVIVVGKQKRIPRS